MGTTYKNTVNGNFCKSGGNVARQGGKDVLQDWDRRVSSPEWDGLQKRRACCKKGGERCLARL